MPRASPSPASRWAANPAPRRCAASAQYERDHGRAQGPQIPWKERDHALFVAFAPVGAPRYVCAAVVEHGGASGGGGSAVAAPICRDVLLEAQRRDPARRVRRTIGTRQRPTVRAPVGVSHDESVLRHRPARADASPKDLARISGGWCCWFAMIAGFGFAMLYSAADGNMQPWAATR